MASADLLANASLPWTECSAPASASTFTRVLRVRLCPPFLFLGSPVTLDEEFALLENKLFFNDTHSDPTSK